MGRAASAQRATSQPAERQIVVCPCTSVPSSFRLDRAGEAHEKPQNKYSFLPQASDFGEEARRARRCSEVSFNNVEHSRTVSFRPTESGWVYLSPAQNSYGAFGPTNTNCFLLYSTWVIFMFGFTCLFYWRGLSTWFVCFVFAFSLLLQDLLK